MVAILLIIFLSFIIPRPYFLDPAKSVFAAIFTPIQQLVSSGVSNVRNFFEKIEQIRDLSSEVDRLQEENKKLIAEKVQLIEHEKENEVLRKQLEFSTEHPEFHLELAQVIGRDPNNLLQYLTINKGQRDGIRKDMPVIYEGFLIGKITETNAFSSKVFLITNPSSVVNAMVQGSRANGLVRGQLGYGLILENVSQDVAIEIGDYVITSGLGNMPKGLIVGQVEQVESIQSELFQKASLKPVIDFTHLETIFVIKD